MINSSAKQAILEGKTALGIELGSTRIKAVLIGADYAPIASGSFEWENKFEDGIWTYYLDDVWTGIQKSYQNLLNDVNAQYGVTLTSVGAVGVSAMMHGYLAFDKDENLLVPFRTWRNTTTERAAELLTNEFDFNIPQRWSIAHLYQAIIDGEKHVSDIAFITTLAGYVHWKLTGEKVLGVGDASGMFPIDSISNDYDEDMLQKFDNLIADKNYSWKLREILPKVLVAGAKAGKLTEKGAKLIDLTEVLNIGIPLCPPEGDAGTGMVATKSVAEKTGNISAGTSIFAMAVLEKPLSKLYKEIDMVTTPAGRPVAMVHCNNCTSDINAWAKLFVEMVRALGINVTMPQVLDAMFYSADSQNAHFGGLLSYNYFSGEPITNFDEGRPLFVRTPSSDFSFANFSRTQLFSAVATLKIGMDILVEKENVTLEQMLGHGGFFKAKAVGQKIMAAALNIPITVMSTAGEGGPWGMALLAAYSLNESSSSLDEFLEEQVFTENSGESISPSSKDVKEFTDFIELYRNGLPIEQAAIDTI